MPVYKDTERGSWYCQFYYRIGQERGRKSTKEVSGQKRKRRIMKVNLSAWQMQTWICQLLRLWRFILTIKVES